MWKTLRNRLPDVDKDDLLEVLGMESRRSTTEKMVPALAIFGAGVLVGVGLGLMLAPRPGRELRDELRHRLRRGDAHDEEAAAGNGNGNAEIAVGGA